MYKRLILMLTACGLTLVLRAQMYVGVHGGVTLPTGYYAESCIADDGWMLDGSNQHKVGAGTGFAAGISLAYAMPFHSPLELMLKVGYWDNGCNDDINTHFNEATPQSLASRSSLYGYAVTLPHHRTITLQAGLRYGYSVAPHVEFYGEALCGTTFRTISSFVLTIDASNYRMHDGQLFDHYNSLTSYTYTNRLAFSCQGGVGFCIAQRVTIGACFCWLGGSTLSWQQHQDVTYQIGSHTQNEVSDSQTDYARLSPTMVFIHLGYRFRVWKGLRHVQDY